MVRRGTSRSVRVTHASTAGRKERIKEGEKARKREDGRRENEGGNLKMLDITEKESFKIKCPQKRGCAAIIGGTTRVAFAAFGGCTLGDCQYKT